MLIIVPFSILLSRAAFLHFSRFQKTDVDFMNRFYAHKFCQEMLIGLLLSDLLCKSILLSFSLIWHMCDFLSLQRFYVFLFHLKKRGKTPLHKWKIITIVLPQLITLNATQRRYNRNPLKNELWNRIEILSWRIRSKDNKKCAKWCAFLWVLWVTALWQWIFTHSFALLRQCAFVSTFNGCNQPTDERTNEPGEWMNLRQIVFINPQNKFSKKNRLNDAHCITDYTSVCTRCPIQFVVYLHFNLSCIECTDHITFLC